MISRLLLIPAFFATVFFPCLAAIGRSAEVELPAKLPGGTALWRLVAQSDVIVGGILVVPAEARKVPFDSFKADISLSATVEERLKDAWPRPKLAIKYYASSRADDSVSPEKLQALHAGKIVAFLAVVDDLGEKPELFFAGYTDDALQPSSPELLDQIRKEVAAQAEVQRSFSTSALARPDSHHAAVAALIEEMVSEKTELEAFEKLEALGLAAVPSIIRLLDDRRELPLKQISLRN